MTPFEQYLERMRQAQNQQNVLQGFQNDPFGPGRMAPSQPSPIGPQGFQQDPFGTTAGGFRAPDPWQDFQFQQNPNSATPPQMGIAPGGDVIPQSYMDPQLGSMGDLAAGGGTNWGSVAGMAGKALGQMGKQAEPQASLGSLPGVGSGSHIRPVPVEYALPLMELMRGAGRGRK